MQCLLRPSRAKPQLIMLLAMLGLQASTPQLAHSQTITFYVEAVQNYLWRDYINGTFSVQPNLEYASESGRWNFIYWAAAYIAKDINDTSFESFIQGSYAIVTTEECNLALGAAYYPGFSHFDPDTHQHRDLLEATLFCDFPQVLGQPSLEFYYSVNAGLYQMTTLSQSVPLGSRYSFDLSAYASFRAFNRYTNLLGEVPGNPNLTAPQYYNGWRDAGLQVQFPFEIALLPMGLTAGGRYMAGWHTATEQEKWVWTLIYTLELP